MNQLTQSLEREGSSPFVFFSRGLAFLARPSVAVWAPIPLRLIVGYGFMEHGFAKLSRGPEAFAAILHTMAVPAPHLMAWLTGRRATSLICSILRALRRSYLVVLGRWQSTIIS
jgi:putative oxidoreductase